MVSAQKGISRAELARKAGLSKTTGSVLVEELIEGGFLVDEGTKNTRKLGRKPNGLGICGERNIVIVANWLTEKVEVQALNLLGEPIHSAEYTLGKEAAYVEATCELYHLLAGRLEKKQCIIGVCVITPSVIDPVECEIVSTILPVAESGSVIGRLRKMLPVVPIAFFNDTACFAYAETAFLEPLRSEPSIFINLNRGIGAVLLCEGEMLRGGNGITTQFGHLSLDRQGEPCRCGNRGCLENTVGEKGLYERARRLGLPGCLAYGEDLSYEHVGRGADAGDEDFIALVKALASDLAFAIGSLVTLYSAQTVVIGGKGQYLGKRFIEELREQLLGCGFQIFVKKAEVCYSAQTPGEKTEFSGAVKYFVEQYYSFVDRMDNGLYL